MGNIKFNASKKTTIILLVVLFFVIGGSGGYLLWRVNQSKTIAPTDSSAGGGGGFISCCKCPSSEENSSGCKEGTSPSVYCECGIDSFCPELPRCCRVGADCAGRVYCAWPEVADCSTESGVPGTGYGLCRCAHADKYKDASIGSSYKCLDTKPRCNPPSCPEGYEEFQRTGSLRSCASDGTLTECFVDCRTACEGCDNEYFVQRDCRKKAPEPPQPKCGDGEVNRVGEECDPPGSVCTKNGKQGVCDDFCKCPVVVDPPRVEKCDGIGKGTDISFVPSTVKKDATINYKYTMGDSKGLDVNSVSVLLNHSTLDVEKNVSPSSGTPTKATVSGKLDTSTVGKHNVMIAWKRPGETSFSEACQIRGNFTVEDVGTPKWDIAKTASEECVVDSDGESIAKLTYSITIKNNGNVTGTITTVTDKLDSKVVDGSVTDISDGGTYSSSDRSIKWGQFDIPAGQTKTLTYSLTVRKDAFGVYDNAVIVKPSDGTDYIANASITADCVEEPYQPPVEGGKVPDTGLFDESENLVIMGGILLFLGLGWTWLNRTYEIVNGRLVQRSKERFEQRVVKN